MAIEWTFQLRFVLALALGFLVGLERESTKSENIMVFGGVRTHPIISMFGFGCAWLYTIGATLVLPAGLLALAVLTAIAYSTKAHAGRFGSTSEISALLTFVTGALALLVDPWIAMATGIVNAVLLSEKARLEMAVERLSRTDFLAVLKFLIVTLIILPVLPDKEFTQFHLNPATVWKMVILVSSVGFFGYVLVKWLGQRAGLWLSGILGGIVSSTAVTIAVGRLAIQQKQQAGNALQASLLASAMLYLRVLVLMGIINPAYIPEVWWKLLILSAIGGVLALTVKERQKAESPHDQPVIENPFEITPALLFALLFVALSVLTNVVRQFAGEVGILGLSGIVGLTDIDPFILSLIQPEAGLQHVVVTAILIAMMSNTLAKGFYFGFIVSTRRRDSLLRYGLWALAHVPLMFLA
jgi:uncharacterized membrane protein (DUF4010 family)